ncbi:YndJ family transporter [Phytohabitans sp. LJ34]|uniref:YndJ family transporter n=1 Tax=Phytohabitans sp. LJ34 TaxID=3452217 RepID=UPI003F8BE3D3
MSAWSRALLDLLICAGLLLVMPLGLRLLAAPGLAGVRRLWLLAAAPAAASVWLPRGWLAASLAAAYVPATAALATSAARLVSARWIPAARLVSAVRRAPAAVAVPAGPAGPGGGVGLARVMAGPRLVAAATALVAPAVAGSALVAERAGYRLFGFDLDVLALTVAHFHYAGFAAALVAGLVCGLDGDGPAGRLAAISVPAGVAVVFVGFFTSEWVELAGAAVLTAGMWLVAALTWRLARDGAVSVTRGGAVPAPSGRAASVTGGGAAPAPSDRTPSVTCGGAAAPAPSGGAVPARSDQTPSVTRGRAASVTGGLLVTSACTLGVTMLLALDWALGRATGLPHLPISWMVATHGLANALGFALCALVAWQRMGRGSEWG